MKFARTYEPMRQLINHLMPLGVLAFSAFFQASANDLRQKILVTVDKAEVIKLQRPASLVSVSNPSIADINIQSPRVIFVIGKSIGETSINITTSSGDTTQSFDVNVIPSMENKVTVNLGTDAVKTLNCLPRCIQISNPGRDPAAKGSSSSASPPSRSSGPLLPQGSGSTK